MRSIINEKNLNNKKILLRLDLNVPLERDKITDTTRIDKILPTLNFLIKEKAKIIILSHVGRPKGKVVKELSLKPICEELQNSSQIGFRESSSIILPFGLPTCDKIIILDFSLIKKFKVWGSEIPQILHPLIISLNDQLIF